MLIITGGENHNFNIKHKIVLNYMWNSRPLVNVNVKCKTRLSTWILIQTLLWRSFAMAALRYGDPSLWRPLAMVDLRHSGPLPLQI